MALPKVATTKAVPVKSIGIDPLHEEKKITTPVAIKIIGMSPPQTRRGYRGGEIT